MAGLTISSIDGDLKVMYDDMVQELNNLNPGIYKRFKKLDRYRGTGSGYYFATRMKGNQRLGAAAEAGAIVSAGSSTWIKGYVVCVYNYRPFQTTGPAVARAKNGGGFVTDVLTDDIALGEKELTRYLNEQAVRSGDGVITQANGAGTTSTSLTVDSTRQLHENMQIEAYASTVEQFGQTTAVAISNINRNTKVVTLAAAKSWDDNSNIYRYNQYNSGTPLETNGLRNLVDDSTSASVENIDPATYLQWTSYHDSSGGQVTRMRLAKAINFVEIFTNKAIDEIWCNGATRNNIFMMVQPGIEFTEPKNLELMYDPKDDPLRFMGRVFPVDECIYDGDIFGLTWETLGKIVEKPMDVGSVIPGMGNTLLRDAGYDSGTGFISVYEQLVCLDRRANFKFTDLTTDYTF
uniref:Capsid protein n=1 Tax=viral metagenome TaxID=1070528 RepID=A0A6M3L9U8_9ZZZZ